MFPLKDENPTELLPFVTIAFIAVNVMVWLLVQGAGAGTTFMDSLCQYGAVPGEITGTLSPGTAVQLGDYSCRVGGLRWEAVITSMFMHGSWMHLLGNMWFLWVFGNNIEDSVGHVRYILFYLITGAVAAGAHILGSPGSAVPMVGASGAISGVMGAYLVLYPQVRIHTLIIIIFYIRIIPVPAWVMLGYWFVLQLLLGANDPGSGGGVAFWAHVGGFVAGVILIKLFERRSRVKARLAGTKLSPEEVWRIGKR